MRRDGPVTGRDEEFGRRKNTHALVSGLEDIFILYYVISQLKKKQEQNTEEKRREKRRDIERR